ncbi:GapR family DNA-binding domain-containing protein [Muricoccus nepalensis]|nr:GapR family DNA-binding domain-containing protein [Roseomonas nepalensis]
MGRRGSNGIRTSVSIAGGEEIDVTDAMNRVGANADLRQFLDRAIVLEDQRRDAAKGVKDVLDEAQGAGFDRKALTLLLKRHFEDDTQRAARKATETALELMERALGDFITSPLGEAARASMHA